MRKTMTAIAIATALSVGILGAVTAAQADAYSTVTNEFDGYPDWANDAFRPKGKR